MSRYDEYGHKLFVFGDLINKTIQAICLNEDKTEVAFVDTEGNIHGFYSEGDCCSHSWIEHMSGVAALLGNQITGGEEREIDDDAHIFWKDDDYRIIVYGIQLRTAKGYFDLEFRNSSNGYYGGQMVSTTIEKSALASMKLITEDF
jgi:hypothetical protein